MVEAVSSPPTIDLSPVDAADLVLRRLSAGPPCSILIEPDDVAYAMRVDEGAGYVTRATLGPSLGNAVAMRLALVADFDPAANAAQLGRVRVAVREPNSGPSSTACEVLLAVRPAHGGLSAEIFRTPTTLVPRHTLPTSGAEDETFGRYRLKRELGRGGMGIVYLGEHVVLQKEVAIKVLHLTAMQNPMLAAQFIVEARAACRARHPGIVDVTDFGTLADGRAYIAMELVEAPTLAAVLEAEGPLPPERVAKLSEGIADALHAASARGVVHRDLTPSNIFVCAGDRPKIGDFGVAKLNDADTANKDALPNAELVVGTAGYMSPEQGLGEAVDTRSDIYSLGCVMYRMITGHVPFSGASLYAVLMKHMNEPPPPMTSPHGPIPEPLARVVLRALGKRPSDRYATAEEMTRDLAGVARAIATDGAEGRGA